MSVDPAEMQKLCRGCDTRKPWSEFWAKLKGPDGTMRQPQARCKDCMKVKRRAWGAANRDARNRQRRAEYARKREDPEWMAARRDRHRQWTRATKGITPDRFRPTHLKDRSEEDPMVTIPQGLRDIIQEVGVEAIAARAGWLRPSGKPDSTRARRALSQDRTRLSRTVELCEAAGVDPVDVGL